MIGRAPLRKRAANSTKKGPGRRHHVGPGRTSIDPKWDSLGNEWRLSDMAKVERDEVNVKRTKV
jgi:hypothetical protein